MSDDRVCTFCGETQAAVRASQRGGDPIRCWDDLYGEAPHHVFRAPEVEQ